jgi:hypothetical protein
MASEEPNTQEKIAQENQEVISSEDDSDDSDDSELSSESSSSSDQEVVKSANVEVKQSSSWWNRTNSWFLSHREASVAILFGIAAIGVAFTYRFNSQ